MSVDSIVQTKGGGDKLLSSTPAIIVSPTIPTIAGNCLVVVIQSRAQTSIPVLAVTDNQGNTWTKIPNTSTAFGTLQGLHEWWVCPNPIGGVTDISAAETSGATGPRMSAFFYELNGVHPSVPVDQVIQTIGNSQVAATGPTASTISASEVAIGATGAHMVSTNAIGASTGYTTRSQQGRTTIPIYTVRTGDRIATSPGTFSWSTTLAGGVNVLWVATIVTFRSVAREQAFFGSM